MDMGKLPYVVWVHEEMFDQSRGDAGRVGHSCARCGVPLSNTMIVEDGLVALICVSASCMTKFLPPPDHAGKADVIFWFTDWSKPQAIHDLQTITLGWRLKLDGGAVRDICAPLRLRMGSFKEDVSIFLDRYDTALQDAKTAPNHLDLKGLPKIKMKEVLVAVTINAAGDHIVTALVGEHESILAAALEDASEAGIGYHAPFKTYLCRIPVPIPEERDLEELTATIEKV